MGVILNEDNSDQIDLQERIKNANKTYFALQKFFKNKNLSKKLKLRLKKSFDWNTWREETFWKYLGIDGCVILCYAYHKEARLDVKDWIHLDWDRVKWSAPVDMVLKV